MTHIIVYALQILCEDYIYQRLEQTLQSSRAAAAAGDEPLGGSVVLGGGGGSGGGPAPPSVSEVSREIQLIGLKLEATYPTLYQSNVSKQVRSYHTGVSQNNLLKRVRSYHTNIYQSNN